VCGLLGREHHVTLVSFGRMPTVAQTFWLNHKNLTYHPTAFPLEWMQHSEAGITESAKYLGKIIYDTQPDILHFSQFCYGALEYGIPKIVVAHSDVRSWWNSVHDRNPPDSPWLDWYTTLVSRGLKCADAVVAPSQWMLDAISEHYGELAYGKVIYNGRDASLFRSASHKTDCVLSVGRIWDEAKQIRLLLERSHLVPIRIAGAVQHPENANSICLEGKGNFKFCGEQNEAQLGTLYSDSAAYAATSRYEPFGLAPVEAALSRCALIANDIPVFRELWGDAAFYFRRNDPDGLATAICVLAQDSPLRNHYAAQAYECARTRFDSKRMVIDYENLYLKLIGERAHA